MLPLLLPFHLELQDMIFMNSVSKFVFRQISMILLGWYFFVLQKVFYFFIVSSPMQTFVEKVILILEYVCFCFFFFLRL